MLHGIDFSFLKAKPRRDCPPMYNVQAEYLVEVFKYPGTGDRIPPDAPDGYGSMPMIGLYSLVDLYSITQITTTPVRVNDRGRGEEVHIQMLLFSL